MTTKWMYLFAALIMGAFLFNLGCDEDVEPNPADDDDTPVETDTYDVTVYTNVDNLFTLTAYADDDVIGNTPTTAELENGTYVFGAEHDNVLCLDEQSSVSTDGSIDLFCGLALEGKFTWQDKPCDDGTAETYQDDVEMFTEIMNGHIYLQIDDQASYMVDADYATDNGGNVDLHLSVEPMSVELIAPAFTSYYCWTAPLD